MGRKSHQFVVVDVCQGLNFHYFQYYWGWSRDGHERSRRGSYTHYKDFLFSGFDEFIPKSWELMDPGTCGF